MRLSLPDVDASAYDALVFWIRGTPRTALPPCSRWAFCVRIRHSPGVPSRWFRVTGITDRWQQMVIPLHLMTGIHEWKHLSAFFLSIHPRTSPTPSGAYFIDEIRLVTTGAPGPRVTDAVSTPAKEAWEAALGGPDTVPARLQSG